MWKAIQRRILKQKFEIMLNFITNPENKIQREIKDSFIPIIMGNFKNSDLSRIENVSK